MAHITAAELCILAAAAVPEYASSANPLARLPSELRKAARSGDIEEMRATARRAQILLEAEAGKVGPGASLQWAEAAARAAQLCGHAVRATRVGGATWATV